MLRRRRKENKRDKDDGDKDIILSLGLADKPPPLSHPPPTTHRPPKRTAAKLQFSRFKREQ